MFSLSFDFNLQKSSSEFKLTLAKFSIPALSGKFCRVTKTQDLTMMTQQHERHFKPRISKEVSLTLRLLERKKRVPTRVCSDELVKIFKAYYQIYMNVEEVVAQKYVYYTKTYVYLNLLGLE